MVKNINMALLLMLKKSIWRSGSSHYVTTGYLYSSKTLQFVTVTRRSPPSRRSDVCKMSNFVIVGVGVGSLYRKTELIMYVTSWDEFEKAAENIYMNDPNKARYILKYSHVKPELCVKITDNVLCVQYKTEIAQDFKKIEKLINNLMRHMTSKSP